MLVLSWLVLEISGSSKQVGLVLFLYGLPNVGLLMVGGVIADLVDQRNLLDARIRHEPPGGDPGLRQGTSGYQSFGGWSAVAGIRARFVGREPPYHLHASSLAVPLAAGLPGIV
ncbi:MAG: MFS transporter [Chloroflexi bacterium]|nr:MFS transporter [Chloroflexota bacterium]MYD47680.1 MFS transporter [Chloroflexota bacterium]